jgi:hypothetical protein
MRVRSWLSGMLALGMALGAAGCKGGNKPARVRGTVNLDGKPLPHATVTFVPVSDGAMPATGVSDPDGSFTVDTKGQPGAMPGDYKIMVAYNDVPSESQLQPFAGDKDKVNQKTIMDKIAKINKNKKTRYAIPEKYSTMDTPFQEHVPGGEITLDLRSDKRAKSAEKKTKEEASEKAAKGDKGKTEKKTKAAPAKKKPVKKKDDDDD